MRLFWEDCEGTLEFQWNEETRHKLRFRKAVGEWLEAGETLRLFGKRPGSKAKDYRAYKVFLVDRPELIICPVCGGKGHVVRGEK